MYAIYAASSQVCLNLEASFQPKPLRYHSVGSISGVNLCMGKEHRVNLEQSCFKTRSLDRVSCLG